MVAITTYEVWCAAPEIGATWDIVYRCWNPTTAHQYILDSKEADRLAGVTLLYEIRETLTGVDDYGIQTV